MSQPFESPDRTRDCQSEVYILQAEHEGYDVAVHAAVRRDDLRAFVVFATIPEGTGRLFSISMLRTTLLHQAFQTSIADWEKERITFGETSWLTRRDNRDWRAIRRIEISKDGTITTPGWFPPVVAEPLLCMLENSVPLPDMPSDEFAGDF